MAVPIIPLTLVGAGGYAVWRGFRTDRKHKSTAANGWRNEAFSAREEAAKGRKAK